MSVPTSLELLGVRVDALTRPQLDALVERAVERREQRVIANHNLHSVHVFHRDARMRAFYAQADAVHVDGMPLVWLARALGQRLGPEHRVTYVDWIRPLAALAARRRWRVFYLGSRPGVAERGAARLRQELPGLELACAHGYFDARPGSDESRAVLARIEAWRTQVLLVGMGMPRQEHWILAHRAQLHANAILAAGACMDYVAGVVPTPPRWMGRLGLEWLFRLGAEPRRLWRRYLLEPATLLPLLVADLRRRRSSAAETGSR